MKTISMEYRALGSISYLIWPVSILIVTTGFKKDRFLRFHGYQSLFLGIFGSVLWLVGGAFLRIIPVLGVLAFNVLMVGWILFLILLACRCLQGEYFKVPLIYDLARGSME